LWLRRGRRVLEQRRRIVRRRQQRTVFRGRVPRCADAGKGVLGTGPAEDPVPVLSRIG
jgi:hypothetical protein